MKKPGFIITETILSLILAASVGSAVLLTMDIRSGGKILPQELFQSNTKTKNAPKETSGTKNEASTPKVGVKTQESSKPAEESKQESKQESKNETSEEAKPESSEESSEESKNESKQESKNESSKIVVKADDSLEITDYTAFGKSDVKEDVKKLQKRLKDLGYGEFPDGMTDTYGNQTEAAVILFKNKNGFGNDDPDTTSGYLDADMLRLLFSDKVKPADQ